MDDSRQPDRSQLFSVRVWTEDLGAGRSEWRGKVQHVVSGETRYFRDWPALIAFLLETPPDIDGGLFDQGGQCMYAGVVSIQLQPGKEDEAIGMYREYVASPLQRQLGNQGVYLLVNRKTSSALAIGLWATEADAVAFETNGVYQQQVVRLASVLTAPPSREVYEVSVQM